MSIELNGQNDIVRRNGDLPDEVVATKAKPSLTEAEIAFLEALPPQSKLKQAYLASSAKMELQGYQVQALVSQAGVPPDTMVAPLQHVTLNAAMSTTTVLTAAAIGTFRKARVAWNNNGASGSAKLRIAVNCDNDVHGLLVAQNAKRRDYEMTMGDGVILVCADPITTLHFSADGVIGNGLHSIIITFGA